jgi:DNA polymerase III subunit delta
MPSIHYSDLNEFINRGGESPSFPSTVLIYGEELLCSRALDGIKRALLSVSGSKSSFEPMDGAVETLPAVLEKMNTYALFSREKIIAVKDSKVFYAKEDAGKLSQKIGDAVKSQDLASASRSLLQLLGFLGLSPEDVAPDFRSQLDGPIRSVLPEDDVLDKVLEFRRNLASSNEDTISSERHDPVDMLEQAILKGFPKGNYLLLTTDVVDKRKRLFKAIETEGVVVDCSVPAGGRAADQKIQESLYLDTLQSKLAEKGKRMNAAAIAALQDKLGFNLRLLVGSVDKLSDYVGRRQDITAQDVEAVLVRTREDPLYALTDAATNRQAALCLEYCDSLLSSGYHPLQLLSALINQFRKLLVVKDFTENRCPGIWRSGCTYAAFQQQVLPQAVRADLSLIQTLESWERELGLGRKKGGDGDSGTESSGKTKKKVSTDLVMVKNPKSAFPIFQLFRKAEGVSIPDLMRILSALGDADAALKSSGVDPRHILDRLIFFICGDNQAIQRSR